MSGAEGASYRVRSILGGVWPEARRERVLSMAGEKVISLRTGREGCAEVVEGSSDVIRDLAAESEVGEGGASMSGQVSGSW